MRCTRRRGLGAHRMLSGGLGKRSGRAALLRSTVLVDWRRAGKAIRRAGVACSTALVGWRRARKAIRGAGVACSATFVACRPAGKTIRRAAMVRSTALVGWRPAGVRIRWAAQTMLPAAVVFGGADERSVSVRGCFSSGGFAPGPPRLHVGVCHPPSETNRLKESSK
jgi:hypothetical protein